MGESWRDVKGGWCRDVMEVLGRRDGDTGEVWWGLVGTCEGLPETDIIGGLGTEIQGFGGRHTRGLVGKYTDI